MSTAPATRTEHGFVLIEVLVSALIIVVVGSAVLSLITATTRSAADQRSKATAYSIAQEDQARLRAMRLSSLNRLAQKREVTLDGTRYTIESTGTFVNNSTGTDSSCSAEGSSADYVRIGSKVSWTGSRKPVVLGGIVSPSNGSLDPNHGTLLVTAVNGQQVGLSGVGISATGAGTFSGSTDSTGCANFSDLPAGNYTMKTSAPGFVNADAQASPWTTTVGVVAGTSTPVSLMYDQPGKIVATFKYRVGSTATFKEAKADSVVVYNALMTKGAEAFGPPGATTARKTEVPATPLFPFKEADTVYAGYCESNKPEESASAARASVIVPANGSVTTPQIQLPALNLKVLNGSAALSGAKVTVTDESCKNASGGSLTREYLSNSEGLMSASGGASAAEPGLPWGKYSVCVSGTISGTQRRREYSAVSVKNLTAGTSLEANLLSGTGLETGKTC
jgi:Tfp pilus assembly protein PilV